MSTVHIVGAGLSGSEAAYFLAQRGVSVVVHEMRPTKLTEAHRGGDCAELVCSNSLKSKAPHSGPGILKREMDALGSLILEAARLSEVPSGESLGVDRDRFSSFITERIRKHPKIQWIQGEIAAPDPHGITLLATGPLTSEPLARWLQKATGESDLYFYDAIAPIIDADTIDFENAFVANRYGKGAEDAYVNCPLNELEYATFIKALLNGEMVPSKNFEKEKFFQGCQPIEAIAAGGSESLRFGPMKPVGLTDPRTGKRPHAVVQLRPENLSRTAYNLVGFQTKLKYGEQKRILRMIPALRRAEFLRLGSIHRNTYVCGPQVLRPDLSLRGHPRVYLAGQVTGVEGYVESSACGLLAANFIWQRLTGRAHSSPPSSTAMGALLKHIVASDPKSYQPANIHFGLFEPRDFDLPAGIGRDAIREKMSDQARLAFGSWLSELGFSARLSQVSAQ
jgi:methylenetetrahydrofolate--tRNA-(uracil-5-)-methyltransferase